MKLGIIANMMGSDHIGATTYRFAADAIGAFARSARPARFHDMCNGHWAVGAQRKPELGRQRGALRF